jgi:hypothetical protein
VEIPLSSINSLKKERRNSLPPMANTIGARPARTTSSSSLNHVHGDGSGKDDRSRDLERVACYDVKGEMTNEDIKGKLWLRFKVRGPGKSPCSICGVFIGTPRSFLSFDFFYDIQVLVIYTNVSTTFFLTLQAT